MISPLEDGKTTFKREKFDFMVIALQMYRLLDIYLLTITVYVHILQKINIIQYHIVI